MSSEPEDQTPLSSAVLVVVVSVLIVPLWPIRNSDKMRGKSLAPQSICEWYRGSIEYMVVGSRRDKALAFHLRKEREAHDQRWISQVC